MMSKQVLVALMLAAVAWGGCDNQECVDDSDCMASYACVEGLCQEIILTPPPDASLDASPWDDAPGPVPWPDFYGPRPDIAPQRDILPWPEDMVWPQDMVWPEDMVWPDQGPRDMEPHWDVRADLALQDQPPWADVGYVDRPADLNINDGQRPDGQEDVTAADLPDGPFTCSINDQDCGSGLKCTIGDDGNVCQEAGEVGLNGICGAEGVDDCQAGLICLGNEAEGYTCRVLCEPNDPLTCTEGQACMDLLGDDSAGYCQDVISTCSLLDQDCGEGLKCSIGWSLTIGCFPDGDVELGEACGQTGGDNCVAGLLCAGSGAAPECMALCEPHSDLTGCDRGVPCLAMSGMEHLNAGVCGEEPECSILDQDCADGQKCTLNWLNMLVQCRPNGELALDAPCQVMRDLCQAGLICLPLTLTEGQCRPLCVPGEGGCAAGDTCTSLDPNNDYGLGLLGSCSIHECSVVDQGCAEGEKCTVGILGIECQPDGTVPLGSPCGGALADDCMAGGVCAGESPGSYICLALCEPSWPATCEGQVCEAIEGMEEMDVGVCVAP